MGMFFAFVYWQMKAATDVGGWGIPTVLVADHRCSSSRRSIGAVIERVVMRGLADAPLVAQLVATIGLLAFFIGLADIIWSGTRTARSARSSVTPDELRRHLRRRLQHRGDLRPVVPVHHDRHRDRLAIGLRLLLYRTRLGVAMRAVVDNRELAALERRPSGLRSRCSRGRRLVDGGARRDLPRRGVRQLSTRDADALHRRRVRCRDHRAAEEPADDATSAA